MEQKYIVALEIGSSHIRAAVGTVDSEGKVQLLAIEDEQAVNVVRYGNIQNVDDVSNRINSIIKKLQNYNSISPRKIKGVYVGIGGRSLMTNPRQVIRQFDDETQITPSIIAQMNEEARMLSLSERSIVEVIPSEYLVDNVKVYNPVGTLGQNIRADINLITCKPKLERNLELAVSDRPQLTIKGKIVRQLAIADLVLSHDEKSLGCMLVDAGAETTTVSIYKNEALQYLVTLPIGARNITRDLTTLHMSEEKAEEVKRVVGDALNDEPNYRKSEFDGDVIEVNNYIRARAGEIAANIIEQAKYAGYTLAEDLPAGIVLVGGGAKLKGFSDLLAGQSNVKVRLGSIPSSISISNPAWQGIDMLDVIALLNAAAHRHPAECTEMPEPVVPDIPDDEDPDGPGPEPIKGKDKKKNKEVSQTEGETRKRIGIFKSLLEKAKDSLFNEGDEADN